MLTESGVKCTCMSFRSVVLNELIERTTGQIVPLGILSSESVTELFCTLNAF